MSVSRRPLALLGLSFLVIGCVLPATASASLKKYDLAIVGGGITSNVMAPRQPMVAKTVVKNKYSTKSPGGAINYAFLTDASGAKFVDLGSHSVPRIKKGKKKTVTLPFKVPATTASGTWFFVSCVTANPFKYRDTHPRNDCVQLQVSVVRPTLTATLSAPPSPGLTGSEAHIALATTHATSNVCKLDGAVVGCSKTVANLTALAEGDRTFTAYARDPYGNVSPTRTVTWVADTTAPTVGTVDYLDGEHAAQPQVTFTGGTDVHAVTTRLERTTTSYAAPDCGVFPAFAQVSTLNPSSPFDDSGIAGNTCVRYQLVTTDAAGNSSTATSANTYKVFF